MIPYYEDDAITLYHCDRGVSRSMQEVNRDQPVLDPASGSRMFYFDKADERVLYRLPQLQNQEPPMSERAESDPDSTIADVALPSNMHVEIIDAKTAARLVVERHYLHRKPPISHAFGLYVGARLVGACTYGTPASRHLQKSACPTEPSHVIELNRLWVSDEMPHNSESWFVSRTLRKLPAKIVVSYADTRERHYGYIYRALNFHYAGWTDMDRKTPRYDYIPHNPPEHTRNAFRTGYSHKVMRQPKVKYWIVTGDRSERRRLMKLCGWPQLSWREQPPPLFAAEEAAA